LNLSSDRILNDDDDVWPVWLYRIFPHYLINVTIFRKMSLNIKCLI
jgi:hypothetical protein